MNIYELIKSDHDKAKTIITAIYNFKLNANEEEKEDFLKLKKEVNLHNSAEESTFYRALLKFKEFEDIIKHHKNEHQEVADAFEILSDKKMESEKWCKMFKQMVTSLIKHMDEEETTIFASAKKVLTAEDARELGSAMTREKEKQNEQYTE